MLVVNFQIRHSHLVVALGRGGKQSLSRQGDDSGICLCTLHAVSFSCAGHSVSKDCTVEAVHHVAYQVSDRRLENISVCASWRVDIVEGEVAEIRLDAIV